MKFIIIGMLGGGLGAIVANFGANPHEKYIRVRILDNDNCTATSYSIITTSGIEVIVLGEQIISEYTSVASTSEAFIYFYPKYNKRKIYSYKVKAEYSNCETLISESREAQRGRLIYEWIENRKFKHQVRS